MLQHTTTDCISQGPEGWVQHWTHNELFLYSSPAAALAVVPPSERSLYELHAYRILRCVLDGGERHPWQPPAIEVEPLTADFQSVGFDAVSRVYSNEFACSPLPCNYMAQEIETNEHCLLPTLAEAEEVALRFSREEPEPGPYYMVEVLRQLRSE